MNKTFFLILLSICCLLFSFSTVSSQSVVSSGTVKDQNGAVVVRAEISVLSPGGSVLYKTYTDGEGLFLLEKTANNSDVLVVAANGFETRQLNFEAFSKNSPLQITLAPASFRSEVTVTANRG